MNSSSDNPKPNEAQPEPALANTIRPLARLNRERFCGKITLSFQDGQIVTLYKEQCIKPTELIR